jgi:hypothetical protein
MTPGPDQHLIVPDSWLVDLAELEDVRRAVPVRMIAFIVASIERGQRLHADTTFRADLNWGANKRLRGHIMVDLVLSVPTYEVKSRVARLRWKARPMRDRGRFHLQSGSSGGRSKHSSTPEPRLD